MVSLYPESGNQGGWSGLISSGTYSLNAAAGKYKVTVTPPKGFATQRMYNSSYTNQKKTPLAIEVVASPAAGAYDLKLKR